MKYRDNIDPWKDACSAARYVARNPYAFPGGYNVALVMTDGGLLCSACVKENYRLVMQDTRYDYGDTGWRAAAAMCMDIDGPDYCDNCGKQLAAYYNDEDEK